MATQAQDTVFEDKEAPASRPPSWNPLCQQSRLASGAHSANFCPVLLPCSVTANAL